LMVASNAQQWLKKPVAMGGGGGSFQPGTNASSTTIPDYDIPAKLKYSTNGDYDWDITDDTSGVIYGTPKLATAYTWEVQTTVTTNTVQTLISPTQTKTPK